ncbi:response regulator transcription factor [Kitasatospora sp. NPDC059795]|uniref:helix-turn-helix transcriptional regulator n=1 Tax=Kitasatospora sp. NPDC059795 TaxID=3346949 RepID=UPI0036659F9E
MNASTRKKTGSPASLEDLRALTDSELTLAGQIAAGFTARDIAHAPGPYRDTEAARQAIQDLLNKTGTRTGAQLAGRMTVAGLVTATRDTSPSDTTPDTPQSDTTPDTSPSDLPPRLLAILQDWTDGRATTDIARKLGVSQTTMGTHVRTLYVRLGVSSPAQAVVVGVSDKLVRPTAAR